MESGNGRDLRIPGDIRGWLGWCPSAPAQEAWIPEPPDQRCSPVMPAPGSIPAGGILIAPVVIPRWMTAVSLLMLISTCFVGGNAWWPVLVLTVIVIFTIILCLSHRTGIQDETP